MIIIFIGKSEAIYSHGDGEICSEFLSYLKYQRAPKQKKTKKISGKLLDLANL